MWSRLLSAALGAWLMAAPDALGYGGALAVICYVAGPIVVGSSFVAAWPVMRPLRWISLVAGACLLAATWVLFSGTAATANCSVVALVLMVLAPLGGGDGSRFGGGWRVLLRSEDDMG